MTNKRLGVVGTRRVIANIPILVGLQKHIFVVEFFFQKICFPENFAISAITRRVPTTPRRLFVTSYRCQWIHRPIDDPSKIIIPDKGIV